MRKVLLVLSMLISLNSYGEWTYVISGSDGSKTYIDTNRIRKTNGYTFFWVMDNYGTRDKYGDMSSKLLRKADCGEYKTQVVAASFHTKPWGGGSSSSENSSPDWNYAYPGSIAEEWLNYICK